MVLGNYDKADPEYGRKVKQAASDEVIFPGAIYNKSLIQALRFHASLYIHGHTVGGTNPSLVEALGAGNAVLAHDNKFNRWVAGSGSCYFRDEQECCMQLDALLDNGTGIDRMKAASASRHQECFTWDRILDQYHRLFTRYD